MSVERMLVVSIFHISPAVAYQLELESYGFTTYPRDYKFMMFTHEMRAAKENGAEFPDCLKDIFDIADEKYCTLIMLDRDGEIYPELTEYNW